MHRHCFLGPRLFGFLAILVFNLPSFADWQYHSAIIPSPYEYVMDAMSQRRWVAMSGSGLWQSNNGGQTWLPIQDQIPISNIVGVGNITVVDPAADTVIVTTWSFDYSGDRVALTLDGGQIWENLDLWGLPFTPARLHIWPHGHHVWFAFPNYWGFARSTDGGQTWTEHDAPVQEAVGLYQDAQQDSTLYAAGSYNYFNSEAKALIKSTDLGVTWTDILDLHELYGIESAIVRTVLSLGNGDLMTLVQGYVYEPFENGALLMSTDRGETWDTVSTGLPAGFHPFQLVEDTHAPGTLFIIGFDWFGVYRSQDYGRHWSPCTNGLPAGFFLTHGLNSSEFNAAVTVSLDNYGAYQTTDHGESWQAVSVPPVSSYNIMSLAGGSVFVSGQPGSCYQLDAPYAEWQERQMPAALDTIVRFDEAIFADNDLQVVAMQKESQGEGFTVTQLAYSYDQGITYQLDPVLQFNASRWFTVTRNDSTFLFAHTQQQIRVSDDLGHTWQMRVMPDSFYMNESAGNATAIYGGGYFHSGSYSQEMFRSTDLGMTWDSLSFPGATNSVYLDLTLIGDDLFVTCEGTSWDEAYECWRWSNGVWEERTAIPDSGFLFSTEAVRLVTDTLLVGASSQNMLWVSRDFATTWEARDYELPYESQGTFIYNFAYDPPSSRLWASTSAGTCYILASDLVLGTGPARFEPVAQFSLSVYPNPFNAQTRISYEVEKPGMVTLELYDVTGRLTQSLVNERQNGGRHDYALDAADLPSGSYFLRLMAESSIRTERILLLK